MSKQAMKRLLKSLEDQDYIVRSDAPDKGRARVVRLTKRGRAAYSKVNSILESRSGLACRPSQWPVNARRRGGTRLTRRRLPENRRR
ncbi:MAG: hypothetical protein SFV54_20110 [Bryobacteraceae bacterium]|nr:hypothetical protein [Bryobacteraceae bacterium]